MTSPLLEIRLQKGQRPGSFFQCLKTSSISVFHRHIFNNFVGTVIWETKILVIFNVFMKYSALTSSQNMMFNDEIYNNGGVHILIFGEMVGFEIVPFIAKHVKMIFFFSWSYEFFFFSQSELATLHENN